MTGVVVGDGHPVAGTGFFRLEAEFQEELRRIHRFCGKRAAALQQFRMLPADDRGVKLVESAAAGGAVGHDVIGLVPLQ